MIKPDRLPANSQVLNSNDQGDYIMMASPTRFTSHKNQENDYYKSPQERKTSGNQKKNKGGKAKRKFTVNRNHMKQQKGYIERISEEKSSDYSYK